ncbi:MAG: response regulator [Candidatus Cloacimonetes bacterium]|nr:response regulator [Candidatus Cloacimonadota bacterium]
MKKYILVIGIYLLILGMLPSLLKYKSIQQNDLVIDGFFEAYYHYFDMYEFFLRKYLSMEISENDFDSFLETSRGSNYDILILSPEGNALNDISRFSNSISASAIDSIIIISLQNPLMYFAENFVDSDKTFIFTAKKINTDNNEIWTLIVISDISVFTTSWATMNRKILAVYMLLWTLFYLVILYFYNKEKLSFNNRKFANDLINFVHNIIKNDEKSYAIFLNNESQIQFISASLASLLDYKEEYLSGRNISFLINDFNLSDQIQPNKTGEPENNEVVIRDKRGTKYVFLMALIPHYLNTTELESCVLILYDITYLKENVNQLGFEVKKNVALNTIAQLVMSVSEPASIMKMVIEESRNLIDFDSGTTLLLKKDRLTLFYTDDPHLKNKMDSFSLKLGEGLSGVVAKTGKAQIINDATNNPFTLFVPGTPEIVECIMSAPLINNEGRMIGVITFSRKSLDGFTESDLQILEILASHAANIFDKTELLNKILEDEKRHNTLINESALAILIIYDKNIIFCNRKFCELIKYNKEYLTGRNIIEFISEKDRSFFISQLTTFTLVGKTEVFEYEFVSSDDKTIILEFSLSSISWDGKTSILASASDVTEKIELNKRMLQTQKLESIGTLTSGIAHDFKNIMSGIVGAVELILLSAEEGTRVKNMAKVIKLSADRAVKLSQRLLGFSRKVEDEIAVFDINNLIRETLEMVSYTFDKNIELKLDLTHDPLFFEGDSVKIQQCVMNICVNARDVMPQGGTLTVRTMFLNNFEQIKKIWSQAENRNYTCIEIADTGPGIPEHIQNMLFEPFFTTKSKEKGTGLGLSTSRSIIGEYKGTISLKSKINHGTSFYILLPWLQGIKETEEEKTNEGDIKSHTVLLVDDEEIVLDIAKDLLEELGSTVYASNNGYDALKMVEDHPEITMALIDRMMPKLDGLALLKKLKEIKPEIIVIIASGFLQDNIVKEFTENGAYECITKPYRLEQLARILREV